MKINNRAILGLVAAGAMLTAILLPSIAGANHSWGNYHWARTSNPFTIKLGNNTAGSWTGHLATASSDWSQSAVLDTTVVAGRTKPKACRPTKGRVEVCNANYGGNGWLGLAQIWISGSHITQGIVKNNDYYFGNSTYSFNNEAEKLHVMCQEIGHTLGLNHQSENGSSLNTCMDYYYNTSDSDTTSTHPNQHDYDQLAAIYSHLDSTSTVASSSTRGHSGDSPGEWGKLISSSRNGRSASYERDFGAGNKVITFVIWTP